MSLQTYFEQLKHFLLQGGPPGPLLSADPPSRIGVYANAYAILRETVLSSLFPRLKGALTAERWSHLRDDYFRHHPPSAWEINANAAAFPEFVAEQQGTLPPFAAQLADYEWVDFALGLVTDEVKRGGPLRINPTATLKELDWDFPAWMHAPPSADPPESKTITVLMYRHPAHERTWCRPASPESLLALKLVAEEVPPRDFGATTGLPEEEVRRHLALGIDEGWLLGTLSER